MSELVDCPNCERGPFEHIGQHWNKGDRCSEPQLTEEQEEVIAGTLMGDGCVSHTDKNPALSCLMINQRFLEHLDEMLGVFSTGVRLARTAEESAEENRERGFRPNADAEDYSDQYQLDTRNLEQLHKYEDWYSSGEKVWPEDLELTPTVLKYWYVGDGSYQVGENQVRGNIVLSLNNEREHKDKIESYFHDGPGVTVDRWREYEAPNGRIDCAAVFHADTSEQLFDYMGSPLPGFGYKWPDEAK